MIKKKRYIHDFVTGLHIPVVEMNMTSRFDVVDVRRLRATWTPELAQDIQTYHNIDAEAELTALLSEQVAAEIDRDIIRDLRGMAPHETPDPIQPRTGRLLTSGEVGNTHGFRTQQEIREETINRWNHLGLLDGLTGRVRENIAHLYVSEASTLINETANEPENGFGDVQFPIVRRVMSHTVGLDIVATQPLNPPTGLLHYMDIGGYGENIMNKVTWRTSDTWEYEGLYGSLIGPSIELKPFEFIPKKNRSFLDVQLPRVNRRFC